MGKALLTVTPRAIKHMEQLLAARAKPALGVRIGVKSRGCSGLAYTLEYADEVTPYDEVIDFGPYKLFIDPKAVMFLIGAEMDYREEKMATGFVFNNPNEKGRCGCGESFHV